jgi:hypothetical protein
MIPTGLIAGPQGNPRCRESIIGPQFAGQFRCLLYHCPRCAAWKDWITGTAVQPHLIIIAAPHPTRYVEVINGPGQPRTRIRLLGRTVINGWKIRVVFVPRADFYSAFAGHFVFVWTVHGHTYAAGFHDVVNEADTIAWDRELVGSIRLVPPR